MTNQTEGALSMRTERGLQAHHLRRAIEAVTGRAWYRATPPTPGAPLPDYGTEGVSQRVRHRWASQLCKRVHPRECGGNAPVFPPFVYRGGPSPRVRGKQRDVCAWGNTLTDVLPIGAEGPSPRVRRKRLFKFLAKFAKLEKRSIPARAGETPSSISCDSGMKVHPRACGGNAKEEGDFAHHYGPSPRVRGKRITE